MSFDLYQLHIISVIFTSNHLQEQIYLYQPIKVKFFLKCYKPILTIGSSVFYAILLSVHSLFFTIFRISENGALCRNLLISKGLQREGLDDTHNVMAYLLVIVSYLIIWILRQAKVLCKLLFFPKNTYLYFGIQLLIPFCINFGTIIKPCIKGHNLFKRRRNLMAAVNFEWDPSFSIKKKY